MSDVMIIDGNNWFRRRAETDVFGNPARRCFNEIQFAKYDTVLLVWDGRGALKQRRAIYPEYKANRKPPAENIFDYQDEFKKLAQLSRAISVEVPEFEADDVIASLTKMYLAQGCDVFINSNDADFFQLGVKMDREPSKVEPKYMLAYKTLVGDPSDNIKGCGGFGKKCWEDRTPAEKDILQAFVATIGIPAADEHWLGLMETFLPKRVMTWLKEPANFWQLQNYKKVVEFIPIEYEQIKPHMVNGYNREDLMDQALKQFMN